jgi:hypothetical protein
MNLIIGGARHPPDSIWSLAIDVHQNGGGPCLVGLAGSPGVATAVFIPNSFFSPCCLLFKLALLMCPGAGLRH